MACHLLLHFTERNLDLAANLVSRHGLDHVQLERPFRDQLPVPFKYLCSNFLNRPAAKVESLLNRMNCTHYY